MERLYCNRNFKLSKWYGSPSKVFFAEDGQIDRAPAAGDQKETIPFNLSLSEAARKKAATAAAVIAKVKKDEATYHSSKAIIKDLIKALRDEGFQIPENVEFNTLDEAIDYVLSHTDFTLKPLRFGDIHISADATRILRELKVEFIFDEVHQSCSFKVPSNVTFYDLDGNKTGVLPQSDATHWVDISISFEEETRSFLVIIGKDDNTQVKRTLKYKLI